MNLSMTSQKYVFHTPTPCLAWSLNVLAMTSQLVMYQWWWHYRWLGNHWRGHLKSDIQLIKHRFYSRLYSRSCRKTRLSMHYCIEENKKIIISALTVDGEYYCVFVGALNVSVHIFSSIGNNKIPCMLSSKALLWLYGSWGVFRCCFAFKLKSMASL